MSTGLPAASVTLDAAALRPLIRSVIEEVLRGQQEAAAALGAGEQLGYPEARAAALLGMNSWQLRDERRRGRIAGYRGPRGRIYYTREDLLAYVRSRRTDAE